MISANLVKELRETTGAGMLDCKHALEACNGNMEEAIKWLREKGISKAVKKGSRIAAEGLANVFVKDNKAVLLEINSETDFVSKNDEFKEMVNTIGNTILNSDAKTLEEANNLPLEDGTIADYVISKTAKIGEKLSFRRFMVIEKKDTENFGCYLHMGGKIAAIAVISGANSEVAKDVAMQAAAMKPKYVFETDVPENEVEEEKEHIKNDAMKEGKTADIDEKMVTGRLKKYFKEICLEDQEFIKDGNLDVKTYVKNNGGNIISVNYYVVGEGLQKKEENFAEEVMNQVKSTNK